jgi:hypothetical protein
MRSPKVTIIEKKLGREKALGQYVCGSGEILIDPRDIFEKPEHNERERLDTYVHEALHKADDDLDEETITHYARIVTAVLWKAGYRRVPAVEKVVKLRRKKSDVAKVG